MLGVQQSLDAGKLCLHVRLSEACQPAQRHDCAGPTSLKYAFAANCQQLNSLQHLQRMALATGNPMYVR